MNRLAETNSSIELIPTSQTLAEQLEQFSGMIEENQYFVVVSHASPDGDAIGSTLAMGLMLEELGKEVIFYNSDPVPYNFRFLEGAERLTDEIDPDWPADVTIVMDCAEKERVGGDFPEHGWADTIVVVDHHKTWDEDFADLYVREEEAAATGEVIYRVVACTGAPLTRAIAEALYCCIVTDTGSFRYSNTSRTTFRVAGELVEAGVEPWYMTSQIYENQPVGRLQLLGLVLDTLELSDCGRLAFLRIEDRMYRETQTGPELTDGFINYARSIKGVEVATQLREQGDRCWRVSFRSCGRVDVSALAERFGGGGHHNAAGCVIEGSVDQITEELGAALVELLDASG